MKIYLHFACVVAALAILASPASALTTITSVDMAANFDGGNTVGHPDGFTGMAGGIWQGAWNEWHNNVAPEPYTNYLVRTSDETPGTYDDDYAPFSDGVGGDLGNYLYIDANVSGTTGGSGGASRNYAGKIGVDLTQSYTIDFLYRIEEDATSLANKFTTSNDRYSLFDYPTTRTGITTGCGWVIAAHGGTASWMDKPGKWLFFNGQGHLGDTSNTTDKWIDSGISIAAGQTLSFHLEIDPVNKLWDATITDVDNPTSTFTQTGMGWRIDTTAATGDPNAVLSGLTQFMGQGNSSNDERQFSLDSLHIQQASCSYTIGGMNTVAAHFDDGDTDQFVDGFTGKVGGGWNSVWNTHESNAAMTTTIRGEADNPLHTGSGNYLEMVAEIDPGSSSYGIGGVTREYTRVNEDGIDWTKKHTIEFSVRIDDDMSTFDDAYDQYQIFDQPYTRGGSNGESTWAAKVSGDGDLEWEFRDGPTPSSYVDSNIALTAGGVYDFTIEIDPTTHTYDVTLTDGTNVFEQDGLGWWNYSNYVGGFLSFMARGNTSDDVRAWSIDEIIITEGSTSIPGDTNNDNVVNDADATTVASHWGETGLTGGAAVGDFNGDGIVNAIDASIMAAHWGGHNEGEGNSVPEPSSLIFLGLGVLMLAVRRR